MANLSRRELLESWRRSPLAWVRDNFPGLVLRAWQEEVLRSFEEGAHKVIHIGPRGAGKTLLNALLVLWHATTNADSVTVCVAGVWRQAESLLEELRALWARSGRLRTLYPAWKIQSTGIDTGVAGWRVVVATATQPENLESMHSVGPAFVVIDEARSLPDSHFNSLQGILTTPGSRLVASSVAGRPSGFLYRALHGEGWFWDRVFVFRAADLPFLAERYNAERARLGSDDPTVAQQWESRFVDIAEWAIFSPELIESCVGLDPDERDTVIPGTGPVRVRNLGWDPARTNDTSTLCLTIGRRVAEFIEIPHVDTMKQVGIVAGHVHRLSVMDVAVDSNGMGMGCRDRLAELLAGPGAYCPHRHKVEAFNAAKASTDPERFFNVKTQLVLDLKRLMEDGELGLPPRDGTGAVERLTRELAGLTLVETMRGASRIQDPEESPDYLDAMLIALSLRPGLKRGGGARMIAFYEHSEAVAAGLVRP